MTAKIVLRIRSVYIVKVAPPIRSIDGLFQELFGFIEMLKIGINASRLVPRILSWGFRRSHPFRQMPVTM